MDWLSFGNTEALPIIKVKLVTKNNLELMEARKTFHLIPFN